MNKQTIIQALKAMLPDVAAVLFFVVISCLYFTSVNMSDFDMDTSILKGERVLMGHDHTAADGLSRELNEYAAQHGGERSRWSSTIFSGMPTYQISPSYNSTDRLSFVQRIYRLFLPTVASYIFMMLLGFYIMLRCFNFRVHLAALGAVIWAFSSYFFIIIAAGHIWKVYTLCFIPPTIAGMLLCYKGKQLWGIAVTGLFSALQILSNHPQMSYYFLFVMGFIALAFLIDAIRQKKVRQWVRATGCFSLGVLLGAAVNLSNLFHTWQYSKETMRGKTELTQQTKDEDDQTKSGLERSYITQWSYGIGETWSLLVPNVKGGASVALLAKDNAMEMAREDLQRIYAKYGEFGAAIAQDIYGKTPQYFGEQPGTSGPVYVGAFICFLFVLGLFIVKGPLKWCLLAATVLSILLSWGKNFMPFTDFFLDFMPMYDKFRTVASILVIAEFTIPLLAIMALRKMIVDPECIRGRRGVQVIAASFGLTGGLALMFGIAPNLFFGSYLTSGEVAMFDYYQAHGYPADIFQGIADTLTSVRRSMFTSDAFRSFGVIAVGTLAVLVWRWGKIKSVALVGCLTLLCLVDMWTVNKRYLSNDMFQESKTIAQKLPMSNADVEILMQEQGSHYRVLDCSVSTFNDNSAAYYHKSIGGYHAAKLRRYQELIESHLLSEKSGSPLEVAVASDQVKKYGSLALCNGDSLFPVLNMLNMKYMICATKENKVAIPNPWANGCAWFVDELRYVNSADEELGSLGQINTKHTAVADESFRSVLGEATPADSSASVQLIAQEANRMEYEVTSQTGGVVVFSEIYYPGWTCTIDGESASIGRVNYVLRATRVPAGKHKVVMTFDPQSVHTTEAIANVALIILLLIILTIGGLAVWKTGIIQRARK